MWLKLQIPDDVFTAYEEAATKLAAAGASATPEDLMAKQLAHYREVSPTDRIVVVDARHREKLEELLPSGSLSLAADLVQRVERLAKVQVGEVKIPFTSAELEEITYRAARRDMKPAELIRETVEGMHSEFFNWPDIRPCRSCGRSAADYEAAPVKTEYQQPAPLSPPVPEEPPPAPSNLLGGAFKPEEFSAAPTAPEVSSTLGGLGSVQLAKESESKELDPFAAVPVAAPTPAPAPPPTAIRPIKLPTPQAAVGGAFRPE